MDLETAVAKKSDKRIRSRTIATEFASRDRDLSDLKDPQNTKERVMKRVPPPIAKRLSIDDVFDSSDKPNAARVVTHFSREGRLELECAKKIIQTAKAIFREEPNLLELKPPLTVCGDLHGQYFDWMNVMKKGGEPSSTQYLFLGDYVDRGCFSTDVLLALLSYKINYPKSFWMLRGNHECRLMTSYFNFKLECTKKYNQEVYDEFMDLFDAFPLSALTTCELGSILFMHGGLSPEVDNLEDIRVVDRFMEPPKTGALCDLIWSDPIEEDTAEGLTEEEMEEWYEVQFVENPTRGCGFIFGYSAVIQFLEQNNLLCIVRAHEVQAEGYHLHHFLRNDREHPPCITVFSAPNYCDMYNNQAAMMCVSKEGYSFKQVGWTDHPFYLPDMMDGLNWSFPFVVENLTEISLAILKIGQGQAGEDDDDDDDAQSPAAVAAVAAAAAEGRVEGDEEEQAKATAMKGRLKAVRNMLNLMNGITKEREQLLQFKKFADLGQGPDAWKKIKAEDAANERLPDAQNTLSAPKQRRRRTKTI